MPSKTDTWRDLGTALSVQVIAPISLSLPTGSAVFTALLPQFGAQKGMVVDADGDHLWKHRKALLDSGYGFSTVELGDAIELESAKEMLRDWGWAAPEPAPAWL